MPAREFSGSSRDGRTQSAAVDRRLVVWIAAIAVALLILVAPLFWVFAPARISTAAGGYFAGQVPGKGPVFLTLMLDGINVAGALAASDDSVVGQLQGELSRDGSLRFEWTVNDRDSERTNGSFIGVLGGEPPVVRGTLSVTGGAPVNVEFRRIATMISAKRRTGFRLGDYGGTLDCRALFPEFAASSPFLQKLNQRLRDEAVHGVGEFTAGGLGHIVDGFKNPGMSNEHESSETTRIVHVSGRVVSLCTLGWQYTGGAHGFGGEMGRTFIADGDDLQELRLPDLFTSGSGWERQLSTACLTELKRMGASSAVDGSITNLPPADLASFTVSPKGLTFYFAPYAVASYAEGSFTVDLKWESLKPFLRTNALPAW